MSVDGIGRSATNPMSVCHGGLILGNSLIRANLRGDVDGLSVTVVSLVNQAGPGSNGAAASTLTALTSVAAASLTAQFGYDGALAYLDESDGRALNSMPS